jgi:hypothetical protein
VKHVYFPWGKLGNIDKVEKILARNLNFEPFLSIFGPWMVLEMSEIWYSSSTFKRAFIWYPWARNRTIIEKKKFWARSSSSLVHTYDASDAIDAKHGFESKSLQVMLEIGQNSNFQPKPNLLTLLKCQKVCRLCSKVCAGPFQNLNLLT